MKYFKKTSARLIVIAIIFALIAGTVVIGGKGKPADAALGIPFGGLIAFVKVCTCSANFAVKVVDVAVPPLAQLPLIYQPGVSILFPFGMIFRPGAWTLGLWAPGGVCLIWAGKICVPFPTQGTIMMVGTSM